ncbi:hypothetical protein OH77DRAFT_1425910 [Trametes cingulata]|nr:hypothetical protein OH77DRAFT_1425910 [Trametes cingulata]
MVEAELVYVQALSAIGLTNTQLTATVTEIAGVPVVEVSSIHGQAITIATGTAGGAPTTFAGKVFTAIPDRKNKSANTLHGSATLRHNYKHLRARVRVHQQSTRGPWDLLRTPGMPGRF